MKMASSTTLFGIVLAVSMFGAGIVADRLTNVYITNFPLDEQGNLRVKAVEKPLEIRKEAIEILVQDWTELQASGISYGVPVVGHLVPLELLFAFSPKQAFQNATRVVVSLTLKAYHTKWKANITLNGKSILTEFQPAVETFPTVISVFTNEPDILQTIASGVNSLTIEDAIYFDTYYQDWREGYIWIYRATAFIEYEYQA